MTFWPGHPYVYVVRENDDAISVFAYANGLLGAPLQEISTLPTGVGGGGNTCAEIAIGKGNFLYASNRGHDSIAVFSIDPSSGELALVQHQPTGGETPRHFTIDATGTLMLVGNQGSSTVAAFAIDAVTGKLSPKAVTTNVGPVEFVGIHYIE
ncbi:MAG: beta-propeller fold lactonase family protein [Polyangiaceae bacterium]